MLRVFKSSDRQLQLTLPTLSDFGFVVCLIFFFFSPPLVLTGVQTGWCNQMAEQVSRKCDQRCFMQY